MPDITLILILLFDTIIRMNNKPLPIGIQLLMILLFSVFAVASVTAFAFAVKCMIENDPSLIIALITGAVTGVIAAVLLIILIRDHKKFKDTREASLRSNKKGTNYIEKYSRIYTKDYTNERIRKQIEENSAFFRTLIFMLLLNVFLIIMGIGVNDTGLYQRNVPCIVFGITFLYVTSVGIYTMGSLYMLKHIWPSCSGKRYKAKEINDLSNHPDTVWHNGLEIYITPDALIGFNRGLTVVDYEDIVSIKAKKLHHMKKVGFPRHTAGHLGSSLIFALLDKYKEWDTYLIIIKTRTHKRMVLSETGDSTCDETLKDILDKRDIHIQN